MRRLFTAIVVALAITTPASAEEGKWALLFDGKSLTGWKSFPEGTGEWKVQGGAIVGSGKASHLFTERGDYTNFHLRAEVKINEGGNSGMYFRTAFGPGFPKGYEAQINSTHRDPIKTGSLYGFGDKATVKEMLVKPDEWFKYEVNCTQTEKGPHIIITVNGKKTVDFVDEKNTYKKGHFAFQQHHVGSEVQIRKVEVMELTGDK